MSSTLDRLTDAMTAAAGTVKQNELRPLIVPERRRRRWGRPAWTAPIAAAAAVVLVIGLAVAASDGLFRARGAAGPGRQPTPPHRFYLTTDVGSFQTVVRSTATGRVVAAVPVPSVQITGPVAPALAAAANSTFYIAAFTKGAPVEQIYRFRITAAGHVAGFARIPGGSLRPGWTADALAATADGSLLAASAYYYPGQRRNGRTYVPERPDQIVVIHTGTGAQSVWRGGSPGPGYKYFRAASLSWTSDGRELAVLGQWCRTSTGPGGETCPQGQRQAQLRAIRPAGRGSGSVLGGRLLLSQSPRIPYLAQALISPGGRVITAMVLRGRAVGNPQIYGMFPEDLSVRRFVAATGRQLGVLYQRRLGDTSEFTAPMADPLAMSADATGRNLMLNGGICNPGCTNEFNGWLHGARLVPLRPSGFAHREAAETW